MVLLQAWPTGSLKTSKSTFGCWPYVWAILAKKALASSKCWSAWWSCQSMITYNPRAMAASTTASTRAVSRWGFAK